MQGYAGSHRKRMKDIASVAFERRVCSDKREGGHDDCWLPSKCKTIRATSWVSYLVKVSHIFTVLQHPGVEGLACGGERASSRVRLVSIKKLESNWS